MGGILSCPSIRGPSQRAHVRQAAATSTICTAVPSLEVRSLSARASAVREDVIGIASMDHRPLKGSRKWCLGKVEGQGYLTEPRTEGR